jgi:hypothetical protein
MYGLNVSLDPGEVQSVACDYPGCSLDDLAGGQNPLCNESLNDRRADVEFAGRFLQGEPRPVFLVVR